ncbi:MFS transporter [Streptomyces paromomycinus]|uniref:MFS transporter n=1 Tax=Streptomyces paromomycinus TaxID=92743 RepID=A0A401VTL0_STREY|nr:MFS transporter [Streptomyces paromomycinus]
MTAGPRKPGKCTVRRDRTPPRPGAGAHSGQHLGVAPANGLTALLVSRLLSGAATSFTTAPATSSIVETVPSRKTAAVLATAAGVGSLSPGVIGAGLLTQLIPAPIRTVFRCCLGARAAAGSAWPAVTPRPQGRGRTGCPRPPPDTSTRCGPDPLVRRQRRACGRTGEREQSLPVAPPAFLRDDLGTPNLAVLDAASVPCSSTHCWPPRSPRPRGSWRRSTRPDLPAIGMSLIKTARWSRCAPVFIAGTVFAGPAVGIVMCHGLGVTHGLSEPGSRAEFSTTYFLFVHSGLVGPLLLRGVSTRQPKPGSPTSP